MSGSELPKLAEANRQRLFDMPRREIKNIKALDNFPGGAQMTPTGDGSDLPEFLKGPYKEVLENEEACFQSSPCFCYDMVTGSDPFVRLLQCHEKLFEAYLRFIEVDSDNDSRHPLVDWVSEYRIPQRMWLRAIEPNIAMLNDTSFLSAIARKTMLQFVLSAQNRLMTATEHANQLRSAWEVLIGGFSLSLTVLPDEDGEIANAGLTSGIVQRRDRTL